MSMTSKLFSGCAAFAGAVLLAGNVLAADVPAPAPAAPADVPFDVAFGTKFMSNYMFRGISQSNNHPVIQGYAEAQFMNNFFYVGVFASKVDLVTRPSAETDVSFGIRPKWGPLTFDIGYILYGYPNERRLVNPYSDVSYTNFYGQTFLAPAILSPKNTDFGEVHAAVTYNYADTFILGTGVYHAWNWLGTGAPATYVNGTAKYNIPAGSLGFMPSGFAISGELGYYGLGTTSAQLGSLKLKSYTTWNVGASYTYKNLTVDLRYSDTNLNKADCFLNTSDPSGFANGTGKSKWCGATFMATVSADFTMSGLASLMSGR